MSERPNIVLILADDLGYSDLGCYGGEIETPYLDRLADSGLRFTHFYNNAKCMPTRASLLTGLYPAQVTENGDGVRLHARNNVTLAEMLGQAGYATMMSGKWQNGSADHQRPVARGFERYWGLLSGCSNYFNPGHRRPGEAEPAHKKPGDERAWCDQDTVVRPFTPSDANFYSTDAINDRAVEFLDGCAGRENPFFLYLSHCAPHFPLQAWPEEIEKYRTRYAAGWVEIRRRRYERLLDLGLIDSRWARQTGGSADDFTTWAVGFTLAALLTGAGLVAFSLGYYGAWQGRYLFVCITPIALLLCEGGARWLPRGRTALAIALLAVLLIALDVALIWQLDGFFADTPARLWGQRTSL